MDVINNLLFAAGVLVSGALVALVARWLAQRLLGAPVGAVRSLVVGIGLFLAISPVATMMAEAAQLMDPVTQESRTSISVVLLLLGLAFGWAFALGVALLVFAEALAPSGSLRNPLEWLRDALARRRRTRRYLQVLTIFSRHGLRTLLRRGPSDVPTSELSTALIGALNASGVTFIKLGQVLSTRSDVIPPQLAADLSALQTSASPEPWDAIEKVLEAELGERMRTAFTSIDPEPLAAASVAQVHRAVLEDGTAVVVKVQRPGARESVTVDVDIVGRLGARAEASAQWARDMGVASLATGFGKALLEELDYGLELANTQLLGAASRPPVSVPAVFPQLCTERVIVMEMVDGVTLGRASARLAELDEKARTALARHLLEAVLRQVLVVGVFHADLHPGNVVLRENGELALLDLGSVGVLDRQLRELILGLLASFDAQDNEAATTLLLQLVDDRTGINTQALRRDLGAAITVVAGPGGLSPAGIARLFEVFRVHRLQLPPHVAAALRTFASLQGCLEILNPGADLVPMIRTAVKAVAGEMFSADVVGKTAISRGLAGMAVLGRLPARVDDLASQLESGELTAQRRLRQEVGAMAARATGEVVTALLSGVLLIAAVLLLGVNDGPMLTPVVPWSTYLAGVTALVGFVLGMRILFRQFTARR